MIRTPSQVAEASLELVQSNDHVQQWQRQLRKKAVRRRAIRYSWFVVNLMILLVVGLIIIKAHSGQAAQQLVSTNAAASNAAANPLDQLSSADIATSLANLVNLPEATAVRNQAQTVSAELAVTPAEDVVAAKPQVIATSLKSRADIQTYVTQPGDTISSLASKFNVTSNSIEWSNGLLTSTVAAGTKLSIPPVNGIVYTTKSGDTAQSLAQKYNASADEITTFNDAEISGFTPGEQIVIPNGQVAIAPVYSFTASYGYNGYDYGFCTWYVASQIAVPDNWGNASSWAYYARLTGWNVSSAPTVGAIAQTPYAAGGQGHVAIVDAVSADGTQIQFKDMNGVAGYGRVGQSSWVSASTYVNYLTQ